MNLYLLRHDDSAGRYYDETVAVVVAAQSPGQARRQAAADLRHEGEHTQFVWFSKSTSVTLIGLAAPDVQQGSILTDYRGRYC